MLNTTATLPTPTTTHPLHCDACGTPIHRPEEVRLLRRDDRIPEDRSYTCVHAACVTSYVDDHTGTYQRYALDTVEAAWLLPIRT